jgi:hypothetical protein
MIADKFPNILSEPVDVELFRIWELRLKMLEFGMYPPGVLKKGVEKLEREYQEANELPTSTPRPEPDCPQA